MREIKVADAVLPEELNLTDDESCCPVWSGPVSESSTEPVQVDDFDYDD